MSFYVGKYTPQYVWLKQELASVDRTKTPWLIVLLHSPWYNSNEYHYMEGETMRVQFESWLVKAKVDIVFAGHVHAYERTVSIALILQHMMFCFNKSLRFHAIQRKTLNWQRKKLNFLVGSSLNWDLFMQYRFSNIDYNIVNGNCTPKANPSAPVYVVIGDGGNAEGLAGE